MSEQTEEDENVTLKYTVKILEEGVHRPQLVMLGLGTVLVTFDAREGGALGVEIVAGLSAEELAEFFEDAAKDIRKHIVNKEQP